MKEHLEVTGREAVLVEDAAPVRVMGQGILEALPSRSAPDEQVDPFILVHEGRVRLSDLKDIDTRHPHRGFDNLWYLLKGSVSTGHTTGVGGAVERARLSEGALLELVLLGPGDEFRVTDASPGTRYLLMAGRPYGEAPLFNGPYVG
jgi:redox-sensitive bicupin YhaK (pirin superfamily)